MGEGQLSEICDTMHCKLGNHRRVFIIHERLQLLCFNLQALTTSDWIQVLLSLLLTSVLPPFHYYVFGFSFGLFALVRLWQVCYPFTIELRPRSQSRMSSAMRLGGGGRNGLEWVGMGWHGLNRLVSGRAVPRDRRHRLVER